MIGSLFFYFVVFALTCICAHQYQLIYNKNIIKYSQKQKGIITTSEIEQSFLALIIIMIPVLVSGLRYGIGTDYFNYEVIYQENINNDWATLTRYRGISLEIAPYILCRIANVLFGGYQGFVFLMALLTGFFFFIFFKENLSKNNFPLMLFIYFILIYPASFNVIRQIVAVSIVAYSLKYVFQRKFVVFMGLILLATTFHTSAIFCLFLYYVYAKRNKSFYKDFLFILFLFLIPSFFEILFGMVTRISFFSRYIEMYSNTMAYNANYIDIIIRIPIALLILLFSKKLVEKEKNNRFFILLYATEFASILLGFYMHWAFRFLYYGIIAEIALVPQMIKCAKRKERVILQIFIIIYYLLFFWTSYFSNGNNGIFPYTTIFN